jgi:hypothetical protein
MDDYFSLRHLGTSENSRKAKYQDTDKSYSNFRKSKKKKTLKEDKEERSCYL